MSKKGSKIIKLAAVALIGYGVYKAFFAEDNDVYKAFFAEDNDEGASATAANSGSGTQSRGSRHYHISGRGEVSESEYNEYQAQIAAKQRQEIAELTERLNSTTDESEKAAILRQLHSMNPTSHR